MMIDVNTDRGMPFHHMSEQVEAEVKVSADGGAIISDNSALAIAAGWQAPSGHGYSMAQLASRGRVDSDDLLAAIDYEMPHAHEQGVTAELVALRRWAHRKLGMQTLEWEGYAVTLYRDPNTGDMRFDLSAPEDYADDVMVTLNEHELS